MPSARFGGIIWAKRKPLCNQKAINSSQWMAVTPMSIEQIRDDVRSEVITFGPHLVERICENGIAINQVLDVVLSGTVRKKEPDERSGGKFTKFTIRRRRITVTVKDCRPAFIITANRK